MITSDEAAALAQAYIEEKLGRPERVWCARTKRLVTTEALDLKVHTVMAAPFGYTVTYNSVPPSLAGHHPVHVGADGSDVRIARLREIWEADPAALPHRDRFIEMEEEGWQQLKNSVTDISNRYV